MGESVYDQVVGREQLARECRIYAPVGSHETLLAYLVRRLLENGANSSFVNRIVDPSVAIDDLVADPVARARATGGAPHPRIPRPRDLFRDRRNSRGLDLSDEARWRASRACFRTRTRRSRRVRCWPSPAADRARGAWRSAIPRTGAIVVGTVDEADATDARAAVAMRPRRAAWSRTPADERAAHLERAADLLEAERDRVPAARGARGRQDAGQRRGRSARGGRFLPLLRAQARRELARHDAARTDGLHRPWNFPLAIFVGQVSAALAAGNPVLAKPAEQTPLIAPRPSRLLHRAGVPRAALQFLPGRGEMVGAALVADPRIAGVLFTGSTEVARVLQRTLAPRRDDPVLIAETGGQNAMIVDSSALPEQVVADALVSAFDSAGQRCSALRVLCVQEEIADRVLAMLRGAMPSSRRRPAPPRDRRRPGDRRGGARAARSARRRNGVRRARTCTPRRCRRPARTARSSRPRSSRSPTCAR